MNSVSGLFIKTSGLFLYLVVFALESLLFVFHLKPRQGAWWKGICCLVGSFLILLLYSYLKDLILSPLIESDQGIYIAYVFNAIEKLLLLVMYGVTLGLMFKLTSLEVLFLSSAVFAFERITYDLACLLTSSLDLDISFLLKFFYDWRSALMYIGCFLLMMAAFYFLFLRKYEGFDVKTLTKRFRVFLYLSLIANILIGAISTPRVEETGFSLYYFFMAVKIFLNAILVSLQFYIVGLADVEYRLAAEESLRQQQEKQFEEAKANAEQVNLSAHDLRHQLNLILEAINKSGEKNDEVLNRVNGMFQEVDDLEANYHTGNVALDTTLTNKARLCQERKIILTVIADGAGLSFLNEVDLFVLIGNILDNAIEACSKIKDPAERFILFTVRQGPGGTFIHCENSCLKAPSFRNGLPQTSKEDKKLHGFGLKSIQNVLNSYSGTLSLRAESKTFYLDAFLPSPSPQPAV